MTWRALKPNWHAGKTTILIIMPKLHYACTPEKLDPVLRNAFFLTKKTKETTTFLAKKTPFSQLKFMLFVLMSVCGISHYNIMGILWYETFLIDHGFVKNLCKKKKRLNFLDIGAWNGSITKVFESYIPQIFCHEPSPSFQKILRKRGYKIATEDGTYDIVSIFNVLDICADPQEILNTALKNLAPSGMLIISLPFPIWTRSWDIRNIKKTNNLWQPKWKSFEMSASEFYDTFLRKNKLKVTGFTRLPYLVSRGECRDVAAYDNGLFICTKEA